MTGRREQAKRRERQAHELLKFYDELTALNACNAFVMQALASALEGGGLDDRSATGAVLCTQLLNDRAVQLERELRHFVARAHAAAQSDVS